MSDEPNPWTRLSSRRFYESRYVAVEEDEVRHRSGRVHPYTALRFRIVGIAALPVDEEGRTRLVGQYRYLSDCYTWELPRGAGPLETDPVESAKRELAEETGLRARAWLPLLNLMVSPGITDERAPCFVAWDLEQETASPDPTETLAVRSPTLREAIEACLAGEIVDAASVASLLTLQARAGTGDLPEGLLWRVRRGLEG
jgi:8-oxo-dGTP pyrophosphatase MutT (NUDIX family)